MSYRARIVGTGMHVPERVVSNDDLAEMMDTSDEWIRQRTGIETRRYVQDPKTETTSVLGAKAAEAALSDAGLAPADVECVILATLSAEKCFPGDAAHVQARLDIPAGVPAFDVRDQCSGFVYGLQMADAFIRSGIYKNVLLVGAEVQSRGLDFSTRGRDVAVIFGDGAGAVVLQAESGEGTAGVMRTEVHADGRYSDVLHLVLPAPITMREVDLNHETLFPQMDGKLVFKHAVTRMPEAVQSVLQAEALTTEDINLLIPHQANLRISEMVQRRLKLRDDQVFNNIQRYGNTTAASIPIALHEAILEGKLKEGDLLALAAFGAGFTWGAALIRW